MEMTMRWYGRKHDTVTLEQIHQICYVKGIITTLYEKLPGEVWTLDEILTMKNEIEDAGLHLAGIESVNVSDAIKTGSPDRDRDIENYIKTLEIWEKQTFIQSAIISCLYLTGQEQSLTENEKTVLRFWLTAKNKSMN